MRTGSDLLKEALKSGVTHRLVVDAFYGATRTAKDLPVVQWELQWDAEAQIKSYGKLVIAYSGDMADSYTPKQFTDLLAPFGQELNILLEVSAGEFSETIQLGHYRIVSVPDARDEHMNVTGRELTVGSRVTVTVQDRLVGVKRRGFRYEEQPPSLTSCWGELARLTGMQVIRSVPDKAIPASVVYAAEQGGRLNAVQALADVLGGVAYVTPDGALSVLSDEVGDVVLELTLGDEGTLLDVAHSMDSEGVYNTVVGNFTDADNNPITAVASLTTGDLGTDGPFGEYTRYYSSPLVKTQEAAQSAVDAILARAVSTQTYRVPVQCLVNPLVEFGDVVSVQRPVGDPLVGRIVKYKFGSSRMMSLEMDVTRAI